MVWRWWGGEGMGWHGSCPGVVGSRGGGSVVSRGSGVKGVVGVRVGS